MEETFNWDAFERERSERSREIVVPGISDFEPTLSPKQKMKIVFHEISLVEFPVPNEIKGLIYRYIQIPENGQRIEEITLDDFLEVLKNRGFDYFQFSPEQKTRVEMALSEVDSNWEILLQN